MVAGRSSRDGVSDGSTGWWFRRECTAAPATIATQMMTRIKMKMSSAGTRVPL